MKIAGLDIGTTGCKLTVFDENGSFLDKAYRDYPLVRTDSGHEIDIGALTEGIFGVLEEMTSKYKDIKGIGVTSFGEAFVMTDKAGLPLNNPMVYTDPRGSEECKELSLKLGKSVIAGITGLAPHEMYSLPKIMWIRKHRPEVYGACAHIFLIADYVIFRLTGNPVIDHSLASRTMAFDIIGLKWADKMFEAAGIDQKLMSRPVPAGTIAGQWKGIDIIAAAHDQVAAACGAGVFDGNTAVDGAGTVQCLTPVYDSLPDVQVMASGYFCVVPFVIPGKYAAYAFSYTGGALIRWCVDCFGAGKTNEALENAYKGKGPTGLLVLPHFAGAATPYMDTGSKGALLGLTTETGPGDIYRACMEGVCYEMKLNYDRLLESGIRFTSLHATGGGAKSNIWMQMKADVLNLPVTSLETSEAGTVGCAMIAGIAEGLFKDLKDGASRMVRKVNTFLPDPAMHLEYMKVYERYKKLYNAVRPLMDDR